MDTKAELLAVDFDLLEHLETAPSRRTHHHRKGQAIFQAGDPADSVYFVKQGHVALSSRSDQGKEAVIGIIKPGECFGQLCVFKSAVRGYTAHAITELVLTLSLDKRVVIDLIDRDPKFNKALLLDAWRRVDRVEQDLIHRVNSTRNDQILARSLLQMADKDGAIGAVSQSMLAAKVGTTRSRIGVFMRSFQEAGLLHYDGPVGHPRHVKVNVPGMQEWLRQD